MVVTFHHATLTTRRPLRLTWAGLAPAGTRQLAWRTNRILESVVNILIGYGIAIAAQKVIFPLFDMHVSTTDNLKIGALFTIVSLIRSYVLRRAFNWWHVYKASRGATV